MKIAILGGTFDPPHFGHQLIAQQVINFTKIEEVWLTPCYQHTFGKKLTAANHRKIMTKMLVNEKIKYCDEEIKNKLSGATIDLMQLLEQKYPQHQFYFLIGADNLSGLHRWKQWKNLITKYNFLVFPRPHFKSNLTNFNLEKKEYKIQLIKHRLLVTTNISSTNIRERVKKGLSIKYLVPEEVRRYIYHYRLYK